MQLQIYTYNNSSYIYRNKATNILDISIHSVFMCPKTVLCFVASIKQACQLRSALLTARINFATRASRKRRFVERRAKVAGIAIFSEFEGL